MPSYPAHEEYQIFVKQVPRYLADTSVAEYYKQNYHPFDIRNVYPNGYNTTLVVSFRTPEEAVCALSETNGLRLDGIILQVESYARIRPARAMKNGSSDGDASSSAGPAAPEAMGQAWPLLPEQKKVQQGQGKGQGRVTPRVRVVPPLPPSPPSSPAFPPIARGQDTVVGQDVGPESRSRREKSQAGMGKGKEGDSPKPEGSWARECLFTPHENMTTPQRIHMHHCRNCSFCQMRMRRRC